MLMVSRSSVTCSRTFAAILSPFIIISLSHLHSVDLLHSVSLLDYFSYFSSNSTLLTENRECIEKTLKTLCRIAKKAKHTAEKYAISFFKSFRGKSFNLWPYVCYSRSFSALLLEHNFGIHKLFFFSTSAYH